MSWWTQTQIRAPSPLRLFKVTRAGDFVEALNQAERLIRYYPDWHQGHTLAITCCRRLKKTDQEIQFAALGTCSVHDGRHLFLAHAFETFMRHDKFYMALTIGREYARSNRRDPKHLVKEVFALLALGKCKKPLKHQDLLEFLKTRLFWRRNLQSDKQHPRSNQYLQQTDQDIKQQLELYDQLITLLLENGNVNACCVQTHMHGIKNNQKMTTDANQ